MRKERKAEFGETLIENAVQNYLDCLNLPQGSQVLIVTDRFPKQAKDIDENLVLRKKMSEMISKRLTSGEINQRTVELDHSMSNEDAMSITAEALQKLNATPGDNPSDTTTIVYLGDSWSCRNGMYKAADEFGGVHNVRIAGSLGFTTGDCKVMSQLNQERRKLIEAQEAYFEKFFNEHPTGVFDVVTSSETGEEFHLSVSYDTTKSPFESDSGWFGHKHKKNMGNVNYVNIPGGEKYGPPDPWRDTDGCYMADGIIFQVEDGLVTGFKAEKEVLEKIQGSSQNLLLQKISEGKRIPFSELGLGYYTMAGIDVYDDGSILSQEKEGPHSGIGVDPTGSHQALEMKNASGDFRHTDFVMNNPKIYLKGPEPSKDIQFYPPPQN
jgi:hypothetical protein